MRCRRGGRHVIHERVQPNRHVLARILGHLSRPRPSRFIPGEVVGQTAAMHFTEDHELFRKSTRAVLEREIVPNFDEWERTGIVPGARAVQEARRRRPARARVRPRVRRPGRRPLVHRDLRRGARPHSRRGRRHGHQRADRHGHPVAAPVRHRGAEAALPGARHPRRDGRRDRRHRARRRLRRRRHPDPRRARRRRVGHQRHQALHHQRHPGRLAVPAGPHVRRGRVPRHVADRRADGDAGLLGVSASSTSSATGRRTPPSCRSSTCGCRWPTPSARSAAASSSRCSSSRTSA